MYTQTKILKESKILRIDDAEILQDINKQNYYAIEIANDNTKLFISESEADKYRTDATEWEKFFKVCETDADENILSNIQDLEKVLELTDEETKDLEKIIEDVNENNSRTDRSTSEIAEIYKRDTDTKKSIVKKLRTLNVTHIHELEAKAYDFLKKDKSKQIDYEYLQDRCKETEIWSKIKNDPGFNTSECKNIKCKKDLLTFVNPVYFLNHLEESGISNLHAVELLEVQRRVMKIKCLKMGNFGIYNIKATSSQTYCNHAVFLTIQAVDADYTKFTGGKETIPDAIKDLPADKYKAAYNEGLRKSNIWCDVLEYQAEQNIIKEISNPEDAQKIANRGYVVIVCWKNNIKKGGDASPHFATIMPGYEYDKNWGCMIANVGGKNNQMREKSPDAFGIRTPLRYFYNPNQKFRKDYNLNIEIQEKKDR